MAKRGKKRKRFESASGQPEWGGASGAWAAGDPAFADAVGMAGAAGAMGLAGAADVRGAASPGNPADEGDKAGKTAKSDKTGASAGKGGKGDKQGKRGKKANKKPGKKANKADKKPCRKADKKGSGKAREDAAPLALVSEQALWCVREQLRSELLYELERRLAEEYRRWMALVTWAPGPAGAAVAAGTGPVGRAPDGTGANGPWTEPGETDAPDAPDTPSAPNAPDSQPPSTAPWLLEDERLGDGFPSPESLPAAVPDFEEGAFYEPGAKERAILAYLSDHPDATQEEVSGALYIARSTVADYTSNLQAKGLLRREGSRRSGRWVVCGDAHVQRALRPYR